MRKITFSLIVLSFFFSNLSLAQYQASWLNDNYAGTNSTYLNPALPGSFPLKWDLNIASAEFFITNNYGFIENASLLNIYKERSNLDIRLGPDLEELVEEIDFLFDFYNGNKKRYASMQTNIMGPALSFRINSRHQVGIFSGAHVLFGTRKVPGNLSYYEYVPRRYGESFRISPLSGSLVAYSEIGINYNFKKMTPGQGSFTYGINLKHLQGWESLYLGLEQPIQVTRVTADTLQSDQAPLTFGYTDAFIQSAPDPEFKISGTGYGVDLGFVYTSSTNDPYKIYDYKIGAALTNLGFINFNKNSNAHETDSEETVQLAWDDYKNYSGLGSLDDAVRQFSNQILRDSNASKVADKFNITLPATLNLHIDYSVFPKFFINANLIQPVNFGTIQPASVAHFSISPRFESRWFGGYLPVSVTNWDEVNVGLAARLGYLIIGTENIKSVFYASKFNSAKYFSPLNSTLLPLDSEIETGAR